MMLHIIVLIAMYLLENIEVGAVKPIYLAHVIEQPNFRIPNPQYLQQIFFVLIFLMILRTHFEASLRSRKN